MEKTSQIGSITVGPAQPLAIIAGPCVLERSSTNLAIAGHLARVCESLDLPLVFKASFDKANRTSLQSPRGPGLEDGLRELDRIKSETGLAICTDIHAPEQASVAAEVADLLQVPAFLCRQTDLLAACAATGRAVNVKKGQFLSPAEMVYVIKKLEAAGCKDLILTERGTFFGYHRLVNDFIGLGDLMALGSPVCFDVTHSTQLPGAGGGQSAGRPDQAPLLARAAAAAGVHALFLECHPDPSSAASDGATVLPLDRIEGLLRETAEISRVLQRNLSSNPAPT